MNIRHRIGRVPLGGEDRVALLGATSPEDIETVRRAAHDCLVETCGPNVYYRGLIEFSNACASDCLYCGIRRSNRRVRRYALSEEEIVAAARWCAEQGYGSVVLQSGERRDEAFVASVVDTVRRIKRETRGGALPDGLGITLCVGEQTRETYRRFFDAGAHRYLLRIETSNPDLFARIHPPQQSFARRLNALRLLRETGFQVGTGVMIGLPGQTLADLAADVAFFVREDVDMIGMGPFVPHEATPLGGLRDGPDEAERMRLSLLMIAVTRLSVPDLNIAATTALQALDPTGREKGLRFGANVMMPLLTPVAVRPDYLLYPGKPCLDESAARCRACLEARVKAAGRRIACNAWGDSLHAARRGRAAPPPGDAPAVSA